MTGEIHCPLCGAAGQEILKEKLTLEDLVIEGLTVRRAGKLVKLTPREFWLLVYLIRNKNFVVTRRMIEEHSWGTSHEDLTNKVDVYISYLREKIDAGFASNLIHTVRGYGYILTTEKTAEEVLRG